MNWLLGIFALIVAICLYDAVKFMYQFLVGPKFQVPWDGQDLCTGKFQIKQRVDSAIKFLYANHGAEWVNSLGEIEFEQEVLKAIKILDGQVNVVIKCQEASMEHPFKLKVFLYNCRLRTVEHFSLFKISMEAAFDIEVEEQIYTVTPVEKKSGSYLIMAGNVAIAWIQRDHNDRWVEMDPFAKMPLAGEYDEQVNAIGNQIECYYHSKEE